MRLLKLNYMFITAVVSSIIGTAAAFLLPKHMLNYISCYYNNTDKYNILWKYLFEIIIDILSEGKYYKIIDLKSNILFFITNINKLILFKYIFLFSIVLSIFITNKKIFKLILEIICFLEISSISVYTALMIRTFSISIFYKILKISFIKNYIYILVMLYTLYLCKNNKICMTIINKICILCILTVALLIGFMFEFI